MENLIYKGLLANPITLKNYFEKEKDEINVPDYLIKITKFSTSSRQTSEYSKLIYDLFVKRELIKISENIIDTAKLNDLDHDGQSIIENFEKSLFDLAEKGSFNSSIVKFDEAMKQTIEMASNAYKNEEGIVGVPTGLRDLDDRLGESKYLAGENYTIADIATWPWLARHDWHDIGIKNFKNLTRWYLDISDRDAVKKGYDFMNRGEIIPKP